MYMKQKSKDRKQRWHNTLYWTKGEHINKTLRPLTENVMQRNNTARSIWRWNERENTVSWFSPKTLDCNYWKPTYIFKEFSHHASPASCFQRAVLAVWHQGDIEGERKELSHFLENVHTHSLQLPWAIRHGNTFLTPSAAVLSPLDERRFLCCNKRKSIWLCWHLLQHLLRYKRLY